jgi:hypothetical protein
LLQSPIPKHLNEQEAFNVISPEKDVDGFNAINVGNLSLGKDCFVSCTPYGIIKILEEYKIDLGKNYDDSGTMLYDLYKQEEVLAGASGPLCIAMVSYSDILPKLEKGMFKRVLLVATGALFSPTFVYQHKPIYSISHAVSLEVNK